MSRRCSRKSVHCVPVAEAALFAKLRLGTSVRWLAIIGLIAMQSWLAFSNAAKAGSGGTTYTWTGTTSGDWDTGTNWLGSLAPTGTLSSADIIFNATGGARTSVTCNSTASGINSLSLGGVAFGYLITGTGSLTFNNGGTVTAADTRHTIGVDITANGNLTVSDSGTIATHLGTPSGQTITLRNNGTLTLNPSMEMDVWDRITGSGSLVKNGVSQLYLNHTNDYSGSTTINAGTLYAQTAGALPSTTDVTIASGAILYCETGDQTIATLSGPGSVCLNATTLTLAGSGDSTFSGNIGPEFNPGTVTKTGTGTMTMTSSSSLIMTTMNVNGGTLDFNGTMNDSSRITVGSGGTLTGTSPGTNTIYTLTNNGILSPGNDSSLYGTMRVSGTYTNGANSTVVIHVNATGDCSKITLTGTGANNVTLSGGTVHVVAASGSYTVGRPYTFLTTGGSISGRYDTTVTCDDPSLGFQLVYGTNYVDLVITQVGTFDDRASTSNQHHVASYLDRHRSGASGDFATVVSELNSLGTAESRAAFDAMGGELFGSLSTIGLENTENFLERLANRLRQQTMTRGMTFDTAQKRWDESLLLVSRHQSWLREKAEGWTTWAEGFGVGARLASNGNASGLGYSSGGLSVGMEKWLEEDLLIGLAGGYSNVYTLLDERHDHATIDAGHFAAYIQREFDNRYLTGVAAYGYNAYDSLRHVTIGNDLRTAEASYGGNSFSGYLEAGQNFRGRFLHLQPYAALEYIQLHQNGFTETGADSVNLAVGGVGAESFRSLLGTRVLSYLRTDAGQLITLEGRAAWRHELLNDNRILDATFAGQTGTAYAIQGINVDRDAAILGTGLTYDMTKSLKFGLNYDLLFSTNYTAHAGSGNVALAW